MKTMKTWKRFGVAAGCGLLAWVGALRAEPAKLLVTQAYLFTMEAGQKEPFLGYFTVGADGKIATIGAGEAPAGIEAEKTLGLGGKWVLPGFISAHSHLWQSAYRGLAADQTLMGWVNALYMQQAMRAEDSSFYWFTLQGALDHLKHGITAAYNFNYGGWREGDFAAQQYRAELDSGLRFVHGYNVGRIGPRLTLEQARGQLKTFLAWLETQPKPDTFLSVMFNGAAGFTDGPEQTVAEAALGKEFGLGNHIHYLEWPPGQAEERGKFRWFLDHGLLNRKVYFGHFIHTDDWIIAESVKAGAGMSWNPLSNGRLASGTADIPKYMKAGLRIGMGVDGQASADRADPFENLRAGLYAVRAKYEDATVLSPYDVVRMHTMGSADVMGVADKIGSLEAGKFADFLVIDPTELGVVFDPYATLVFAGGGEHVQSVYVGGVAKVEAGKLLGQDWDRIGGEVTRRVRDAKPAPAGSGEGH